jgi:hypothetical protein
MDDVVREGHAREAALLRGDRERNEVFGGVEGGGEDELHRGSWGGDGTALSRVGHAALGLRWRDEQEE